MPIDPESVLTYFENFCLIGNLKGPNDSIIKNSFKEELDTTGKPTGKLVANLENPIDGKLTEYMTAAAQWYQGEEPGTRDSPSMTTKNIWDVIAQNIADHFWWSRNGKTETEGCRPKNAGGVDYSKGPSATQLALPGFTPATADGRAIPKAVVPSEKRDAIKNAIVKWFEFNFKWSVEQGKKSDATAQTLAENTAPENTNESDAIKNAFNIFFDKVKFTAKPGIPLPPALVPKSTNTEYFPDMAPHKDADNSSVGIGFEREGAAGFCIGPYYRKVQLENTDAECKVTDGDVVQKSPKFKLAAAPIDDQEFFMDDDANNAETPVIGRLRQFLGVTYEDFVRGRKASGFEDGPSGLPVNGGQEITITYKDPDTGLDTTLNTGVRGLNTNGTRQSGTPAVNPNYGNAIPEEELALIGYGTAEYDTDTQLSNWKDNNGNHVLGLTFTGEAPDKGIVWGNLQPLEKKYNIGTKVEPVQCYMLNAKQLLGGALSSTTTTDLGDRNLSLADPRTWGPWQEYTVETDRENRFKYLIPDETAFKTALSTPDDISLNEYPGIKINGAVCLPTLNKSYWGYRLREVFNESDGNPASQAISAGSKGQPDSAGIIVQSMKAIAGPIPALSIQVTYPNGEFAWSNDKVLVNGGKIGIKNGTPFTRTDNNHIENHELYHTIAKHFMHETDGVANTVDKPVTGKTKGGMVYFDVTKQILAPFTPPPLKPFLPNSETYTW